ncbi:MAG: histidine phosphatase family protein [Burkholderiales bacterium]|nr:histidine phosphatase family protein [Burkholderiales bacterium]
MPITRLCLVRHGETEWNAEGRVQGQTDIPLSAVGLAQAQAAAEVLCRHDFTAVYSSDLMRVRQTAAPAVRRLALPLQLDPALRERHYGIFERLLYTEVRSRLPDHYARFLRKDPDYDFETGESLTTFYARSLQVVKAIAARHAGEQVLVFTHGGVLEMVYRFVRSVGLQSPRDFGIPNCGVNWVEITARGWEVQCWADIAHLRPHSSASDEVR